MSTRFSLEPLTHTIMWQLKERTGETAAAASLSQPDHTLVHMVLVKPWNAIQMVSRNVVPPGEVIQDTASQSDLNWD